MCFTHLGTNECIKAMNDNYAENQADCSLNTHESLYPSLDTIEDVCQENACGLDPVCHSENGSAVVRLRPDCEADDLMRDRKRREVCNENGMRSSISCEEGDPQEEKVDCKKVEDEDEETKTTDEGKSVETREKEEKDEKGDKEDKAFELDEEHLKLFERYANAQEVSPPDNSFPDGSDIEHSRLFNMMTMPSNGTMVKFDYIPFQVNPWDVSGLVKKWVDSWYRVPRDFADCAVVPCRFSRVFVPCIVFTAKVKVLIQGMESYTPPERKPGEEKQYNAHVETPWSKRRSDFETCTDVFSMCSVTSSTDRSWYRQWGHNAKHLPSFSFNRDTDLHLLVPLDQLNVVELEHMRSLVCAEQKSEKKSFFQSIWSSVKQVFESEHCEYKAPPSDAFLLTKLSDEDVWEWCCDETEQELIRCCTERWEHSGGFNITRKVECVSVTRFTHTSYTVYLPVYSGMYTYHDKQYRVVVNGYNGKVDGAVPHGTLGSFFHNVFKHLGFK